MTPPLYKSTGDNNVTSEVSGKTPQRTPLETAKRVARTSKVERRWGRASLLAIVDPKLSDSAHRLLCLLAAVGVNEPDVPLSYEEIAWAFGCSKRQAIRWMTELVHLGYVTVTKRHNSINVYHIPFLASAAAVSASHACAKCNRSGLKLSRACYCKGCERKMVAETKARMAAAETAIANRLDSLVSQPRKRTA